MQIAVDMSYEQYFEVNRISCMKTAGERRWNFVAMWYVFPVLGVVFGLLGVRSWIGEKRMTAGVIWAFVCCVYFLWWRFRYPFKVRKIYKRMAQSLHGKMALTPTGLEFERADGIASEKYTWTAFERWLERPDMFLLFPGPLSIVRIPKDKLTSAEQDEVRGWISAAAKQIA